LDSKEVKIESSNVLGHEILNVLPIYEKENLKSERQQAKPEELQELTKLLETKIKAPTVKKPRPKKLKEDKLWLPKRLP